MTLRQKVRKLLETFTVEELAVEIGVTVKTIYRWQGQQKETHRVFGKKINDLLKELRG